LKLELYSIGTPYGIDEQADEWIHIARTSEDAQRNHIEGWGDALALCSPDADLAEYPKLVIAEQHFYDKIRLNYALDYLPYRYHLGLLEWSFDHLENLGKIEVITRSLEYVLEQAAKIKRKFFRRKNFQIPEQIDWVKMPEEYFIYLLYSGGSANDHFKSILTARLLRDLLNAAGFARIRIRSKAKHLVATAQAFHFLDKQIVGSKPRILK